MLHYTPYSAESTALERTFVDDFYVTLRSMQQVQRFVSLATVQPFAVYAGNDSQWVSAKDLMGMFSLDYSRPLRITADCSDEEKNRFFSEIDTLLRP